MNGQQNNNLIDKSAKINYDSIRTILEKIYDQDQGIRAIIEDSIDYNSPEFSKYFSKMITIDIENRAVVIPMIDKYGWISKSKIGEKANEAIFYVIQHSNIEIMEKYFPQLKNLAALGEAKRTDAAMMEDRLLMWKNKKQKYGTQATTSLREDKKCVIWPIEEPGKVDSLRKNAGFSQTVLENAHRLNATYDPNEKLPNK